VKELLKTKADASAVGELTAALQTKADDASVKELLKIKVGSDRVATI